MMELFGNIMGGISIVLFIVTFFMSLDLYLYLAFTAKQLNEEIRMKIKPMVRPILFKTDFVTQVFRIERILISNSSYCQLEEKDGKFDKKRKNWRIVILLVLITATPYFIILTI